MLTDPPPEACLEPTAMLDCTPPVVQRWLTGTGIDERDTSLEKAVKLYLAVRDGIRYDPYVPFFLPAHYQPAFVIQRRRGYCVSKAAFLCAVARAAGIPARLGFATVRNHLATRQLIEFLGSDLFVYHGYVEFYLNDAWVKATPAFNQSLCRLHGVPPLDFNGRDDAVFQSYNTKNQRFMEYVAYHGTFDDVPLDLILSAWRETYGAKRVDDWIAAFSAAGNKTGRDFYAEEAII